MTGTKLLVSIILLLGAASVFGQTSRKPAAAAADQAMKATAAYAEVALQRANVEAELESLLVGYTDEFPKVKELKYSLSRIDAETVRLLSMKPADRDRATSALGKLMLRKVEAEIELWNVQQDYADTHPDVKRARKKVEIFEKAIKEILG